MGILCAHLLCFLVASNQSREFKVGVGVVLMETVEGVTADVAGDSCDEDFCRHCRMLWRVFRVVCYQERKRIECLDGLDWRLQCYMPGDNDVADKCL